MTTPFPRSVIPRQLPLPFGFGHAFGANLDRRLCVYCGRPANTHDHVPARCLLERPLPPNLLTIPCCRECNSSWSDDEQYLQIVLAQIGFQPHLMAKVEEGGLVDRALSRAPALDAKIKTALIPADDGRIWFIPERDRICTVIRKIAFGLYVARYSAPVSLDHFGTVSVYGPEEEIPQPIIAAAHYWPGIRRKPWRKVQEGTFSYLFAKGWLISDPPLYCLLDFHSTLLGVVACPDPRSRQWPGSQAST